MDGPTIRLTETTDPRAAKAQLLAAAAHAPTALDPVTGVVHVLRHREIERLLHEPRLRGVGLAMFDRMGIDRGPLRDWYGSLMFTNDGAPHDRLRRLVSKAFTPRAVGRLREVAAEQVEQRLARVRADGGGDLATAFGGVPMHVMCTLLGVPPAAVPDFIAWVNALGPIFGFMDAMQITAASNAIGDLLAYLRELVAQRSQTPADDLISALIRAEDDGDRLSRDETVAMVANLLVGGHDTTSSQIGCSLFALLSRPDALAALRSEPGVLASLVEETLRFEPAIRGAPRTSARPIELCGTEYPRGTIVMCSFVAAHRDPEVWREPDAFQPQRFADPRAPRLLAFGGGPHYCLGAALARMTLEEVTRGVAALAPKLTADPDSIAWVQVLGCAPSRLPVTI